jgi:hypothetical protein
MIVRRVAVLVMIVRVVRIEMMTARVVPITMTTNQCQRHDSVQWKFANALAVARQVEKCPALRNASAKNGSTKAQLVSAAQRAKVDHTRQLAHVHVHRHVHREAVDVRYERWIRSLKRLNGQLANAQPLVSSVDMKPH